MGEFWETMKGAWNLYMYGTLADLMRANRDAMMGKNPYTGKSHWEENIPARTKRLERYNHTVSTPRTKRLERYRYTVSTPRTSDVVKYEMDLLQKQSQTATPSEFDAICKKYNALKREYEALLNAEKSDKQEQQGKDQR